MIFFQFFWIFKNVIINISKNPGKSQTHYLYIIKKNVYMAIYDVEIKLVFYMFSQVLLGYISSYKFVDQNCHGNIWSSSEL